MTILESLHDSANWFSPLWITTQEEKNVIRDLEIAIIVVPEIISDYIYIQQNYFTIGCPAWMKSLCPRIFNDVEGKYICMLWKIRCGFGQKCKIYDQHCEENEKKIQWHGIEYNTISHDFKTLEEKIIWT